MTFAWIVIGSNLVASVAAGLALWFDRTGRQHWPHLTARAASLVWGAVGAFVVAAWLAAWSDTSKLFSVWQSDYSPRLLQIAFVAGQEPLVVAAAALSVFGAGLFSRVSDVLRLSCSISALIVAIAFWDQTATFDRALGRGTRQTDLAALIGQGQREVLWLTGLNEAWLWLGLPNWTASIQAAGVVFSRELAMSYEARARFLIENGFDNGRLLRPPGSTITFPAPTAAALHALCRRDDAPVAVVIPLAPKAMPDASWQAAVWTAPVPRLEQLIEASGEVIRMQRYATVRCADHQ